MLTWLSWSPWCIGWAQLELKIETPQPSYLQYAPIPLAVHLKNLGGENIILEGTQDPPWLELIVQSIDGILLRTDRPMTPPSLTLRPGESKEVQLDLNPYYLIRDPGGYRVRASARLSNGQALLTEPLTFLIGRGEVVWSMSRGEGKERRNFTLLKFYEDPNTGLYLRVELPEQNLVFPAFRLGPFVPLGNPSAEFDSKNHLHFLYQVGSGQYRIAVVNQDGQLLRQETRQETFAKPKLIRNPDGLVEVQGGTVILPSHLREKLSTLQARAGTAPAP